MIFGMKKVMIRCILEKMMKLSVFYEDEIGVYVSYVGDIIIDSCVC